VAGQPLVFLQLLARHVPQARNADVRTLLPSPNAHDVVRCGDTGRTPVRVGVHEGEEGGGEAHADRQHDEHRDRRARVPPEVPECKARIGGKCVEPAGAARAAAFFLEMRHVSELPASRMACVGDRQATGDESLGRPIDMIRHLILHLRLESATQDE
jgi:hypothetical protein